MRSPTINVLAVLLGGTLRCTAMEPMTLHGAEGVKATFNMTAESLSIDFEAPGIDTAGHAVYVALGTDLREGSSVVPFAKGFEGSTVFLPFAASHLVFVMGGEAKSERHLRAWQQTMWSERMSAGDEFTAQFSPNHCRLEFPRAGLKLADVVRLAIYAKDLRQNDGWGRLFGSLDSTTPGLGDKVLTAGLELNVAGTPAVRMRERFATDERVRIYQLFVRIFGNTNATRKQNGTLAENGVGKFSDINTTALKSLREMNFTHVWLTGVLQQATSTDYSSIGQPADDPDLLKGLAGSPYAIKDYFDVCPDYADKPAERLAEFKALLGRVHASGLKALIDFVPNHVARSYGSDVKPEVDFGNHDDKTKQFDPQNNFFYLQGAGPLRLPTCQDGVAISPTCKVLGGKCDGLFEPEREVGRVTGNNVVSWSPGSGDWYETVKLNYGFDFTRRDVRAYPNGVDRDKPIPDTWRKMDRVIAYWQEMGVDGFRCDMSHMVPPEFWRWLISRARARNPEVYVIGEAYDNDPAKVGGGDPVLQGLNGGKGNVMYDLLNAGFNAVYDDPSYKAVKAIYDGQGWANDLDRARTDDFIFGNSLRYAENHDEVRLAGKEWGRLGMEVGRPVSAVLFALSSGPVLVYNGQELGEPGAGVEGFGGDDSRTSIFDYWSMPALVPWVNEHKYEGGKLEAKQKSLRDFYARLLHLVNEPAFRHGAFYGLNAANADEPSYGKVEGDPSSGHWIYACLRHDLRGGQSFLVIANLHPTMSFEKVHVRFSPEAATFLAAGKAQKWIERLCSEGLTIDADAEGVMVEKIPPLTPYYFELQPAP